MIADGMEAEIADAEPIDQPEVEATDATEPVTDEEATPDTDTPPIEEIAGDGRVVPAKFKEAFKMEGVGKDLRAQFFENREFRDVFPGGVNEAKGILKVMADIGGSEGLTGLQQRAQQLDQLAETARTNPSAVLDEIFQAAPGREADIATKAVGAWAQNDPDSYERAMSGMVAQTMSNIKFDSQMDRALLLLEVGRTEDAQKVLNGIKEQVTAFGQAAAAPAKPKQGQPDPNDQRAQELDTRENTMFDNALGQSIIAYRDPLIFKEAEQWTKGMTLTDRQKGALVRDVTTGIGELLQKDANWMKDYRAMASKRDQAGALRLYQEKAAKIAPDIVKNVSRELFGSPVSAVRKAPAVVAKPVAKPAVAVPGARKVDKFDAIFNS